VLSFLFLLVSGQLDLKTFCNTGIAVQVSNRSLAFGFALGFDCIRVTLPPALNPV
jgi:hypothetical protein